MSPDTPHSLQGLWNAPTAADEHRADYEAAKRNVDLFLIETGFWTGVTALVLFIALLALWKG